jgi:hypothetical protein
MYNQPNIENMPDSNESIPLSKQQDYGTSDEKSLRPPQLPKKPPWACFFHPFYMLYLLFKPNTLFRHDARPEEKTKQLYGIGGSILGWSITLTIYLLLILSPTGISSVVTLALTYPLICLASWLGEKFGHARYDGERFKKKNWFRRRLWIAAFLLLHPIGRIYEYFRFRKGSGRKKASAALAGSILALTITIPIYFIFSAPASGIMIFLDFLLINLASAAGSLFGHAVLFDYEINKTIGERNRPPLLTTLSRMFLVLAIPAALIISSLFFPEAFLSFTKLALWSEALILVTIGIALIAVWRQDKSYFVAILPTVITLIIALFTGFAFFEPLSLSQDIALTIGMSSGFLLLFSFLYNHFLIKKMEKNAQKHVIVHDDKSDAEIERYTVKKPTMMRHLRNAIFGTFIDKIPYYAGNEPLSETPAVTSRKKPKGFYDSLSGKSNHDSRTMPEANKESSSWFANRVSKTQLEELIDKYHQEAKQGGYGGDQDEILAELKEIEIDNQQIRSEIFTLFSLALSASHWEIVKHLTNLFSAESPEAGYETLDAEYSEKSLREKLLETYDYTQGKTLEELNPPLYEALMPYHLEPQDHFSWTL